MAYFGDELKIDLASTPAGSHERNLELARAHRDGDPDALGELIATNTRFAIRRALDYRRHRLFGPDLVSEAFVGLCRAARDFDPEMGFRFTTYAGPKIKAQIGRFLRRNVSIVFHIPEHLQYRSQQDERRGRSRVERLESARVACRSVHLDSINNSENLIGSWSDAIDRSDRHSDSDRVVRSLDALSDRDRLVVSLRVGLDGNGPKKFVEIGAVIGCSANMACMVFKRAVRKLRIILDGEASRESA